MQIDVISRLKNNPTGLGDCVIVVSKEGRVSFYKWDDKEAIHMETTYDVPDQFTVPRGHISLSFSCLIEKPLSNLSQKKLIESVEKILQQEQSRTKKNDAYRGYIDSCLQQSNECDIKSFQNWEKEDYYGAIENKV